MRTRTKVIFAAGLSTIILSFQNCSGVEFAEINPSLNLSQLSEQLAEWKSQTVDLKPREKSEVDILFVIDNSGSMDGEQKELSQRISGFMDLVKDLKWRVALTTTDSRSSKPWGDGQFREMGAKGSHVYFLDSEQISLSEAQDQLAEAIHTGTGGSGDERGINATYRAIERISSSAEHRSFHRTTAMLAVVLISDEDECSNGTCLESDFKSRPDELMQLVRGTFGQGKVFNFHSIIRLPGDSSCKTAPTAGSVYNELSILSGGLTGSICASSYTDILSGIGRHVVEKVRSVELTCSPGIGETEGLPSFHMTLNGQRLLSGFSVEGSSVVFDSSLPEGSYQLRYVCSQE